MRSCYYYLIFLFALVSCDFEQKVLKIASCAFKSEKLRENLLKVIEALKTGDFSNILSIGLASFVEVKKDILDCVNDEPVLAGCKNYVQFSICLKTCFPPNLSKCIKNCQGKFC